MFRIKSPRSIISQILIQFCLGKEVQARWRNLKKRFNSAIQEGRSGDAPKIISKKNQFLITEMDFFRKYFLDNM